MAQDWEKIQNAADAAEVKLYRDLLRSLDFVRAKKLILDVQRALVAGDPSRAQQAVINAIRTVSAEFQPILGNILVQLFNQAGGIAGDALPPSLGASFDLTNPYSVEYAGRRSSQFVESLQAETLSALRSIVTRSFLEGIPPREAARMLSDTIGLAPKEATALQNYREFLSSLAGRDSLDGLPPSIRGKLLRADIRGRNPKLGVDRIERAVEKYRTRLVRERALTLVRTETIEAANAGQAEMWRQALSSGLIQESQTRKKWIVTPDDRLCPICRPMSGQQRGLNESFTSPKNGATAKHPPIHPRCRCAMGLVFKRQAS